MPTNASCKPSGWLPVHDVFVKDLAKKGEDAKSVMILLETEFPSLQGKVGMEWLRKRMA